MGQDIIQVGLADFQFLTRRALAELISEVPGFRLVKETDNPAQLKSLSYSDGRFVLLVDFIESDPDMINLLSNLNEPPNVELLVITNSTNTILVNRLLKLGIKGMVTKNCSEDEIRTALRSVSIGNRFYCNNILNMVMEPGDSNQKEPPKLTRREHEVLSLIAQGMSTQTIADELHISIHTVNSHRKNITKKLNINSPLHLVAYAAETGLVSIDYCK